VNAIADLDLVGQHLGMHCMAKPVDPERLGTTIRLLCQARRQH
jgi:hypothetical protein